MHVKEQVKDFVHGATRKFSQKHKRDTCSTFDSYDYSTTDTLSHLDDSSSSASSLVDASESSRFIKFMRPRAPSMTPKKERHNVLHKVKRIGSKRYRLFSALAVPSERMVESNHKQAVSYQGPESSRSRRGVAEERATLASSRDYPDVIDISARGSVKTNSVTPEVEGSQSSRGADRDSQSQLQPPFDTESRSDTSGTLVTAISGSECKSVSESDTRADSLDLHSDKSSDEVRASALAALCAPPAAPMADLLPDPPREQEMSISSPSPPPAQLPQAPSTPTPTSTALVYTPRLTAPTMFLPIPNTDPLNALLTKYVPAEQRPQRDVVGEYAGRDVHEMVMSNSWRALAKMAHDKIVASDPEDLGRILDLWSLRLSALARLRLTNQASAECTNLFAVLNAVPSISVPGAFPGSGSLSSSTPLPSSPAPLSPLSGLAQFPGTPSQKPSTLAGSATAPRQATHELVHPFELTVFHARVHYWSGNSLGYVDALSQILARCKERARVEGRVVVQRRGLEGAQGEEDVESSARSEWASQNEDEAEDKSKDEVEDRDKIEAEDGDEDEDEDEEKAENQGKDKIEDGDKDEAVDRSEDEAEDKCKDEAEDSSEDETEDEYEYEVKENAEESSENAEDQDEEKDKVDAVLVAAEANLSMWLERIARVCLILASQMIEMNDYQAAINLLTPLCTHRDAPTFLPTPSPELHSALARVYLLSGNLQKAEEHFSIAASAAANNDKGPDIVAMNTALLSAASGDWTRAEEALSEMVARDPENFTVNRALEALNNLAVTLLSQGRIKEGIDLLEAALETSPSSVVVAEPFLFNLSTLYELRSTAAIDKKRGLLIEVAQWSGDGLRTSCLKMPSS